MCFFYSKNILKFKWLLTLQCWLLSTLLFAVDKVDTTKVYSINEVLVTEHYRNAELRSSAPLHILSSKQIEKLNVLQVSDAVKFFPGVMVKDYGGIGGLKTVSVRSLGASHTAVSYDGIALSDCQTGQIDIGRFSLENIDMLSLSNGQSDNIFQPARLFASAAVLNLRTLSPRFDANKNMNGKVSLKAGSFGLLNPAFALQHKINQQFASSVSAEWLAANGAYPYVLDQSYLGDGLKSNEVRKNSDVQNLRLEAALYANFSEKESAFLKAYYYNSERGLPGATILNNESAFTSQRLWDNTFFVQTHYQKDFSKLWAMQLNAKYNHAGLHYLDSVVLNDIGYEESFYQQNEFYASFSTLYKAFKNLSCSFATDASVNNMFAQYENENLTAEFAEPVRYSLLSVVAAKYVTDDFLATASLLSTLVCDQTGLHAETTDFNKFSPYLSFTYKPFESQDLRFRAFYKNIFRLPSFNDLYYARIGNANLRPENSNQYNLGFSYAFTLPQILPLFSVTVDAYRNIVNDKIVAMPAKNLFVWSMVNLGKVVITGVDLSAETALKLSKQFNLLLGASYTYQRALDMTDIYGSTYGHQIPYTPRVSGSGKMALETPWIDLSYSFLWSGKRYAGYQNYAENLMPSYSDHSISAARSFKLRNKILITKLEALNVFDVNYAIVKWFPMPGRSFMATVGLKF